MLVVMDKVSLPAWVPWAMPRAAVGERAEAGVVDGRVTAAE